MKKQKHTAAGLVELLVTVVVIAAVVLLIWFLLKPMEQIAKAKDDRRLSNSRELANAVERYLVATNQYPWNQRSDQFEQAVRSYDRYYFYNPEELDSDMNWVYNLVTAKELESSSAKNLMNGHEYYVYKETGDYAPVYYCFKPQSEMFKQRAAAECDETNGKRTAPKNYRLFVPCQTLDGTIPATETGLRNLLCITETL